MFHFNVCFMHLSAVLYIMVRFIKSFHLGVHEKKTAKNLFFFVATLFDEYIFQLHPYAIIR